VLTANYGGYTVAFSGSADTQAGLEGSQFAIFNSGDATVRIKTSWTGSEAGVQTVSRNDLFTVATLADGTVTGAIGTGHNSQVTSTTDAPTIDMSDTQQAASLFNGLRNGINYPPLTESPNSPVGIVPFKFIASPGAAAAGLTNINNQQFKSLVAS